MIGDPVARQPSRRRRRGARRGGLHRDLKPANVTAIDGRGDVRCTDFGIAGAADEIPGVGGSAARPLNERWMFLLERARRTLLPVRLALNTRVGPYEVLALLGVEAWPRSTAPGIRGSGGTWRSR